MNTLIVTDKERDMILAGLRAYQTLYTMTAGDMPADLLDIAESDRDNTNADAALSQEEVDQLCERINCGE